ncbi:hypothetical protein [Streptantibioticus cattleyicolor]|uniref:Lipoprotein n=1 Tax=Streptantibioticus cattleyicolor (strain ATCC 35852 / DSM 46488 / JCM 4925 / NBRC 14057 / NRRL 8057) TaxID=1003195 RepID=F8JJG2_STREN|nr:hypothetical protein [Streptantibioticus cattleyicolor]AEW98714.1 hypothetical protein SCATT_p05210 [Streptantibioticus cattleyicolor NRRL 8057 = DSM 46488]CCB72232.1 exported protein of unknown function [Streptantibioticus cattleyicolor NRRL 8057 = DSM 46488]
MPCRPLLLAAVVVVSLSGCATVRPDPVPVRVRVAPAVIRPGAARTGMVTPQPVPSPSASAFPSRARVRRLPVSARQHGRPARRHRSGSRHRHPGPVRRAPDGWWDAGGTAVCAPGAALRLPVDWTEVCRGLVR